MELDTARAQAPSDHEGPQSKPFGTGLNIEQLLPGFAPIKEFGAAFHSEWNMRWFLRRNSERLIAMGALVFIGSRYYYHRERMRAALVQIGSEDALQRARKTDPALGGAAMQTR